MPLRASEFLQAGHVSLMQTNKSRVLTPQLPPLPVLTRVSTGQLGTAPGPQSLLKSFKPASPHPDFPIHPRETTKNTLAPSAS